MGRLQDDAITGGDIRKQYQFDLPANRIPMGGSLQVFARGLGAILPYLLSVYRVESCQSGDV